MSPTFDLVDEAWLPCLMTDGGQHELSLRQALREAHTVQAIAGESPPVTVALHRLLLAIVHRVVDGPRNVAHWSDLWRRGAFDADAIDAYLDRWRPTFDLFDNERPFYQTAAVGEEQAGSIAKLLFQADNNPTLFDHTAVATPPTLSPARAARWLTVVQAFDTGGLKTGTGNDKSAKASLLIQCVICLVRGGNLFETLLLNLHHYNGRDEQPFAFDPRNDAPAWEQTAPAEPRDREPAGYLDLLTWQSRRLRLFPEQNGDGRLVVRRAALMKGYQPPDGYSRYGRETMVTFSKATNPKAPDPWPPLGFREERALWRDSTAYLQSLAEQRRRPLMMDWLARLVYEGGAIEANRMLPIELLGLATDRAKLLFWRHERLTVPAMYLEDSKPAEILLQALGVALDLAERGGRLLGPTTAPARLPDGNEIYLPSPARTLTDALTGGKDSASALINHLAPQRGYWQRLEEPFQRLMSDVPGALVQDQHGDWQVGDAPLTAWANAIEAAAWAAWREAISGMERSTRGLRAVALGEREMYRRLADLLAPYRRPVTAGGVA